MKLQHVVYTSTPTKPLTPEQIAQIARRSAEKNRHVSVTGILLFGGGQFMQLLEGPGRCVEDLVRIISVDPRHKQFQICHRAAVTGRLLGEWHMGLLNLTDPVPMDQELMKSALAAATPTPRLPAPTRASRCCKPSASATAAERNCRLRPRLLSTSESGAVTALARESTKTSRPMAEAVGEFAPADCLSCAA